MSNEGYLSKIDREIKREEKIRNYFLNDKGKKLLGLLMLSTGVISGILWTSFYMADEYKQMIEGWVSKENFMLRLVTGYIYHTAVFGALFGWIIYSSLKRKFAIKVKET